MKTGNEKENRKEELDAVRSEQHTDSGKTKKSFAVKRLIIGIVIIIAICAAAFGVLKLIQSVDYMRPVKDICSLYNSRETDTKKLFRTMYTGADRKAYNSAYKIIANSDIYYEFFDSIPEELEDYYRDNAAAGGSNIKMKFDVTGDKTKMDESQLAIIYNELEENEAYFQDIINSIDNMGKDDIQGLADSLGISYKRANSLCSIIQTRCEGFVSFNVTKGYYITGRYVLYNKDNKTVNKTDKITLAIIKLNGSWYIYDGKAEGIELATGISTLAQDDILWDICDKYIK